MTTVWGGPEFFTQNKVTMDAFHTFLQPVRYDDDLVPVYDSKQIEIWGLPDWFGITQYRVIALRETESPMVRCVEAPSEAIARTNPMKNEC